MPAARGQVIIVGGGIAGLSAAYDLSKAGIAHTLIEKQPRLGGVIETSQWDDCVLECGPDSFLSAKPEAMALIRELGLEADVIGSKDAERVTYILRNGHLTRLPEGTTMFVPTNPAAMLASPLVGWGTKDAHGPGVSARARDVSGSQRFRVRDGSLWPRDAGLSGGAAAFGRVWRRSGPA